MTTTTLDLRDLAASAIHTEPRDFDFGSGYGETWETILPDAEGLSVEECAAVLRDASALFPDPDPWAMDRPNRVALLDEIEECDADWLADQIQALGEPEELTDENYLGIIVDALDAEILDGLDDYRKAVRELWDDDRFTPLMNYIYPLPGYSGDEQADQLRLDREAGPVCLVRLLGGGDADDEIALALTGGGMDLSLEICWGYMLLGYLPPLHFADLPEFGRRASEREDRIVRAMIASAHDAVQRAQYTIDRLEKRRLRRSVSPEE